MWNLGFSYSIEYLPSEDLIRYNVFTKSHNVIINTTAGSKSFHTSNNLPISLLVNIRLVEIGKSCTCKAGQGYESI